MAFGYLPFGPQIAYMCESMSFYHKMLEVWRHCQDWIDKTIDFKAPCISQFWHGSKMRELQNFWNPNAQWELPIYCSSPICHCVFWAFPTKCVEMLEGWDNDLQKYQITCSCGTITETVPVFVKVRV